MMETVSRHYCNDTTEIKVNIEPDGNISLTFVSRPNTAHIQLPLRHATDLANEILQKVERGRGG